jgi:predicted Zn finger-like uncharacterized protein
MSSADLATVVIACPNCGTRYQVPYGTLGAGGREVQCAQCGKPWHATADAPPPPPIDPDMMFTPADEAALDRAFEGEAKSVAAASAVIDPEHERTLAEIRAAIAPKPKKPAPPNPNDPGLAKARRAFDRRQRKVKSRLPLARLRRMARIGALATLLALLLLGFAARVQIVTAFPALAGLYASIGMPVNVTGLEFTDAKTLTSLRDGKTLMTINARIRSVAGTTEPVPPVLVSLVDASGATVYEWTATPQAAELHPGEVLDFSTEVNSPPNGAVKVRLSFTTPRPSAASA